MSACRKKRIPEESKTSIVNKYIEQDISMKEISLLFGYDYSSICKLIKKKGINRKFHHPPDQKFLSQITTEEQAYFLGFMYADGSVGKTTSYIKLQNSDSYILEKFNEVIFESKRNIRKAYDSDKYTILYLYNREMIKWLKDNGCVMNKARKLKYPNHIPKKYAHHFIRGFFDGDGCISGNIFSICSSSKEFLIEIQEILMKQCGLNLTKLSETRNKFNDNITYSLRFAGRNNVKKIYNYLYDDSSLYLTRKYIKMKGEDNDLL